MKLYVFKTGKLYLQASATVEAVFVVPIILFAILGVITFCFYMCDRMKIEKDLQLLYEHERMRYNQVRAIDSKEVESYIEDMFSSGYMICLPMYSVSKLSDSHVEVRVQLTLKRQPFRMLSDITSSMQLYSEEKALIFQNKEKTLRISNIGIEILNKGGL